MGNIVGYLSSAFTASVPQPDDDIYLPDDPDAVTDRLLYSYYGTLPRPHSWQQWHLKPDAPTMLIGQRAHWLTDLPD